MPRRVLSVMLLAGLTWATALASAVVAGSELQRSVCASESDCRQEIERLRSEHGDTSPRLIAPLTDLSLLLAQESRHVETIAALQWAIGVARRAHGLFDLAQLGLLERLVVSQEAAGDEPGVEQTLQYALRIAEQNYGPEDARLSPALLRLGYWYESLGDIEAARTIWQRVLQINPGDGRANAMTVEGLLGVGRSHRLQFTLAPRSLKQEFSSVSQVTQRPQARPFWLLDEEAAEIARRGQRALQEAESLLDTATGVTDLLRVRTLLELGDWFTTARQSRTAASYYARAAATHEASSAAAGNTPHPLAAPRLVVYKPPAAAVRHQNLPPETRIAREVRFTLNVNDKGEPGGIRLQSSEVPRRLMLRVRRALKEAVYSPRFERGRPVRTTGVMFTDYWYVPVEPETDHARPGDR